MSQTEGETGKIGSGPGESDLKWYPVVNELPLTFLPLGSGARAGGE